MRQVVNLYVTCSFMILLILQVWSLVSVSVQSIQCWHASVWTKAVDWQPVVSIHVAMLIARLLANTPACFALQQQVCKVFIIHCLKYSLVEGWLLLLTWLWFIPFLCKHILSIPLYLVLSSFMMPSHDMFTSLAIYLFAHTFWFFFYSTGPVSIAAQPTWVLTSCQESVPYVVMRGIV